MRKRKAFRSLYALVLLIFLGAGGALALRLADLRRGDAFYGRLRDGDAPPSAVLTEPAPSPEAPAPAEERETEAVPSRPGALSPRLAEFAKECPGAVLWLQLPGTTLDYPVMLGTDNQFYLNHLPDGSENALGSLFLDCRTREDGAHLIIYGHNGAGGKMFGILKNYESQDYFSEHNALTLATADAAAVCPIFSVRRTAADSGAYQLEFGDGNSLTDYIRQAAAESLYPIDPEAEDAAGVLTLSTCTGRRDQRLLVQALIPG